MERNTHDRAQRPQLCIPYSKVSRTIHLGSLKSFPPVPFCIMDAPWNRSARILQRIASTLF